MANRARHSGNTPGHLPVRYAPVIVTLLCMLTGAALLTAEPAGADPAGTAAAPGAASAPTTVAQVYRTLDAIRAQQAGLAAKYDQAAVEATRAQATSTAAQRSLAAADEAVARAREVIASVALSRYEGGSFSTAGGILTSSTQQGFLNDLSTIDLFSSMTASATKQLEATQRRRQAAADASAALAAKAVHLRDGLAAQRRAAAQQVAKYTALLATLTAKQQTAYTAAVAPPVSPADQAALTDSVSASTHAPAKAVAAAQYAIAQLGHPYVMNTSGPGAFDCSGLTMAAYKTVEVNLPHNAAAQYDVLRAQGKALSYHGVADLLPQLRVGDLIFYYSDIGHVVIYVGGGKAVSAADEQLGVISIDVGGWDAANIVGAAHVV